MPNRRRPSKVTIRGRKKGRSDGIGFTLAEQEVVDLSSTPPYRTYAEIAVLLTKQHPRHRVTESAVKQRMSRAGLRAVRANVFQKEYYRWNSIRRKLRRGQL